MATQTQEIRNMRLISHNDLSGFGNIGEGVHLHQTKDGRRILYLAHESAPKDITGVDVTDLANPRVIVQTDLAYPHLRSNSLSIVGDTMLLDEEYDFDNQSQVPLDSIEMARGDQVRVTCTHFNDTDATVNYGQGFKEEMCYGSLLMYPVPAVDNFVCRD